MNRTKSFPKIAWIACLFLVGVSVLAIAGYIDRKPLLILYHRGQMARHWQASIEEHRRGAGMGSVGSPSHVAEAVRHRTALVELGYYTAQRFPVGSMDPAGRRCQELNQAVQGASEGLPVVAWNMDRSRTPPRLSDLTVYTTPSQMTHWQAVLGKYVVSGN
jgi:hypothetical protein